jgi:HK97 family phage portal protein
VTRIASDIAKLGLVLLAEDEDEIPQRAPRGSPYWSVLRRPNTYQNRIQFITYWLLCKLIWGNSYALKFRDARGIVNALYLLDPRRCQPVVAPDGGVYYSLSGDNLARIPTGYAAAPASEVIHDRAPTLWHPLVGVPPLFAAALSGTLGLQIQRNSAQFFANMSRPSGMLVAPGKIDDATAVRLKKDWTENFSAGNLGKLAVLGDGLKYEAMTIAAEQSQLAQQLGISAVDVATAFGMPAYKINQGQMPANNNVEALQQQYLNDCLQAHIEALELCLTEGLEVPAGYSCEVDISGLMRMDSLTQMEVFTKGTKGGILKPNEARKRMRLGKVEGGDAVYMQQQDFSLAALAKRDAREDPFNAAKVDGGTGPGMPPNTPATPEAAADDTAAEDAAAEAAAEAKMMAMFERVVGKAAAAPPPDVIDPGALLAEFEAALGDG